MPSKCSTSKLHVTYLSYNFLTTARGQTVDGTQELIALGVCNFVGAFFQAMPVTGSFTRSAINHASGVRSTLGGVITTILVVLSLIYLTQSFRYIPKATLAAVIITAMIFMVEFRAAAETWRVKRKLYI